MKEHSNTGFELQNQAALFNILPDAVIYAKRDLTVTSFNRAAEILFEIANADAVGQKINDIVESDITEQTRNEARIQLWEGSGIWKGEANFTAKSGKKTAAMVTFKALPVDDNAGAAWVGIYTDITKFKETQQRLEIALEGMIAGLWDWNIAENTRWWSPRYFQLLGYSYNELEPAAETLRQLLHPDDAPLVFDIIGKHLTAPDRFELEARFKLKSGHYRWFKVTGKAKFSTEGKPLNMAGTIIDIHDKKLDDEIIQEQSSLLQMAPDGIVYGDFNNKIISLNESAERLLETTSSEAIGKNADELLHVKMIGVTREEVRRDLMEKGYNRHEAELTSRSGKKYTLLSSIKAVKNIRGHGPGWIAIYNDITPLRLNEELRVANNYMEQLAFISAHDIKSPIHSLSGLTDLLLRSKSLDVNDRQVLQMQQSVIQQMQRTNKALNDILKLRKGLLAKDGTFIETQHLGGTIKDVVNNLHTDIEKTGAILNLDIKEVYEDQFPFFYMQSIFHNLLSNALKFRDPARQLVIDFKAKKANDNTFYFTISDNGLGFDNERVKDKIFGIFKRFHANIDGTGIGLHITKSIVDAYGGKITVNSAPGKGTTFEITLKNPILI